jgi:hypothetical protein
MNCDESRSGGVGWWDDGRLVGNVFCVSRVLCGFGCVPFRQCG